jgi:hypothetical protein
MDIVKEVSKYTGGLHQLLGVELRSKNRKIYQVTIAGDKLTLFEKYNPFDIEGFILYTPIVYKTEEEIIYLKLSTGNDWWVTHEQFMENLISLIEV